MGSSSITSTFISPWGMTPSSDVPSLVADSPSVTVTVKVVPTPFSLSTSIWPFMSSTMLLAIGMPSPVLPYLLVEAASSWLKASKICGRYSLLMPIPVSFTENLSVAFPS